MEVQYIDVVLSWFAACVLVAVRQIGLEKGPTEIG